MTRTRCLGQPNVSRLLRCPDFRVSLLEGFTLNTYMYKMYMIKINEPQLPWLRTAIIYHTGLDVKMEVTQCISANTRRHQLRWDDWE